MKTSTLRSSAIFCALLLCSAMAFGTTVITIVNNNAPGVGFNDPTPIAPVGGNPGTTLGQQRLNAFQHAADIWGATLDSTAPVRIRAAFVPLSCNATSAVLGSAGTTFIFADFPGELFPGTLHGAALTGKRYGADPLAPNQQHISANFNVNLGNPGCLTGVGWYLGFDNNHGTQIDLVTVLEHEFAHGLGFQQFASITTGALFAGLPDVYNHYLFDTTLNKTWPEMTNAERAFSTLNSRRLVWNGAKVTTALPAVLAPGVPVVRIDSPAGIVGAYSVGLAQFGPLPSTPGVSGNVVQALDAADAAGPSTKDGCGPILNAGAVAGNIAIIDRGTCGFVVKAKNAQNAGAVGVIIADNAAGSPPAGMAGVDPTVTIPAVRVTLGDGNLIKANLGAGVHASITLDLSIVAGADVNGHAQMNAPNPLVSGSSVSHWDPIAFPNQLMEPNISGDLTHSVQPPQDLTLPEMRDVGWYPDADLDRVADDGDDQCLGSDLSGVVTIGGIDTGVPNTFFTNGCSIADLVNKCSVGAANHGDYVSCAAHLTDSLRDAGFLSNQQRSAIQSAAARNK
ncbi:MAG: peptidase [Candidatus Koribacter versatilis]|uniref:Peptidase n=1 Tax=Candidatus Korobacter versatilis TaxID=658062 RepID=A0A932ABG6_9BACT|nr:peptidase [Candidatus Koribacter versatilis]